MLRNIFYPYNYLLLYNFLNILPHNMLHNLWILAGYGQRFFREIFQYLL